MSSLLLSLLIGSSILTKPNSTKSPADSIKNKQIKEVTVYSNLAKTLALPMVVVDRTSLDASSFFTPADALQRETGISLSRDGIWATSVNVRGLSEQRLLFMVDGDRIQTATDIAASLSTINMSSLDRIEVIKGASSVLYGTGAMGGVVNLITTRPYFTPTYQTSGALGTEFNTVNSLWANNARFFFSNKDWYLALNGSYRTAGNTRTPDGKLANSQFNDNSWGVSAGVLYSPNQEIHINYQHVGAWDVGLPGGSAFPTDATVRYKNVVRNQLNAEYIISNVNPTLREVRIKAYTQNLNRDVENRTSATMLVLPSSINKTWGAKITGDWHFDDNHSLLLGAEGWERRAETLRLKVKTVNDTTTMVTGELPTPYARVADIGAFAHYSWKIVPRKWTLNAGLRLDYLRTKNDSLYNPIFQYTDKKDKRTYATNLARKVMFAPSTVYDASYAAHIDLVYNITSQRQLSLSLSNSYRVASLEERFKYIEQQGGILRLGNQKLKPEMGYFSNLDYTFSVNKFSLKVDIFANYLTNLITERYEPGHVVPGGLPSSTKVYVNTNISKAFFVGGEFEANWFINKNFKLLANASYTRARDIDADVYLQQIPPLHGFVSLNYAYKKKLEASLSALWADKQSDVAPSESTTAGHVIYNLDLHTAKVALTRSTLQFFAGVDNILNTAYFNHLSTTRGILKLEPGRNIYLKTRWEW